jgi:hypothetical protein
MEHKKYLYLIFICLGVFSAAAQTTTTPPPHKGNKGKFYFYWGYNRGYYTPSDLHLRGDDYDFTLHNIVAKDRQPPFSFGVYFNFAKLTIPQCNYAVGYYLNDHYSISLSFDHMKYVMVQNQTVKISGFINTPNTQFAGVYDQDDIAIKKNLLIFEHTNGLNYIVTELTRSDNLLPVLSRYKGRKIEVNLSEGIGIGALVPRTDATLLLNPRNDAYHLAGYGISLKAGLDVTFFRHFFLGANMKAGFIHLPRIHTTSSSSDRGSQKFGFLQPNVILGWRF